MNEIGIPQKSSASIPRNAPFSPGRSGSQYATADWNQRSSKVLIVHLRARARTVWRTSTIHAASWMFAWHLDVDSDVHSRCHATNKLTARSASPTRDKPQFPLATTFPGSTSDFRVCRRFGPGNGWFNRTNLAVATQVIRHGQKIHLIHQFVMFIYLMVIYQEFC